MDRYIQADVTMKEKETQTDARKKREKKKKKTVILDRQGTESPDMAASDKTRDKDRHSSSIHKYNTQNSSSSYASSRPGVSPIPGDS